ncbi:P-loop NTPase [Halapricum hydrolyticum]|uniref:Iron-sulfur cluster carrier protein n=1 Tax=Halapricum hydrolyticum TaxID=2979991 RepID=A0AAE3LE30_9EURY|nr:P-loop NTPase [Halapricum hydrolyticum]MCU4716950.1 P-loop NTPase [Halapricum hydrolyticum]MCU4725445.1 P-loop NTPase [Halapricum hydrolyticum]
MSTSELPDDPHEAVREALSEVSVPGIESDLISAGVVYEIDLHGGNLTVIVDISPYPAASDENVMTAILEVTEAIPGIENVQVEQAGPDAELRTSVEDFDRVIAVASAKGGVGKSTVATHLAAALAADDDVALFDADVHGPNVDRILDVDGPVYATDDGNPIPIAHDGLELMGIGLLQSDVPLAWRGAMVHDAVSDLFGDTAWRSDGTLVIDLPPGTGDVVLTTLQDVPVDGLIVVTTPFHTSVADTNRTIDLFLDEGVPVLGAVVNMAEFTCDHCGEPNDLFEDNLSDLSTEVLATLPFEAEFQERPEVGSAPDGVRDLAEAIETEFDALAAYEPPADAVDIRGLDPEPRRDRVRETFETLESGEQFRVVSDRDPTPIRQYLANLAEVEPAAIEPFEVRRKSPDAWELTTVRP